MSIERISDADHEYLQIVAQQLQVARQTYQQATIQLQQAEGAQRSWAAQLTKRYGLVGEDTVMMDGTIRRGEPANGHVEPASEPARA